MRKRLARAPKTKASPRPATMVAIRGVSCGIVYGAPFENRNVGWAPAEAVAFGNMVEAVTMMQPPPRRNPANRAQIRQIQHFAEPDCAPSPDPAAKSLVFRRLCRLQQGLDIEDRVVGQRLRDLGLHLVGDL